MTYLDTHVVTWLAFGERRKLSARAVKILEEGDSRISPIILLELDLLHELKRIPVPSERVVDMLTREMGLEICDQPFEGVVRESLRIGWTRDPFDRLIVAQAALADQRLLTKDERILDHYPKAIWD